MADVLLEVKRLRTEFITESKKLTAVDDVSFYVKKGETFGLIGESGSGKSVTCRSLIRLLKEPGVITGGEILYDGTDLCKLTDRQMQKIRGSEIGMIFQEPMTTLNPVETIGAQIMESIRGDLTRKEKKERAIELMKLVGIPSASERMNSYAHQFSGGMRQRAMIAIALAAEPRLLLADEPTTALDVTIQDQIIRLLKNLQDQLGMSLILVTHDLGVASQICDRIAVMYAGRIMEMASAGELFAEPEHPYTYGLMQAIPSIEKKGDALYSIEGLPPSLDEMPKGCPFCARCEFASEECSRAVPDLVQTRPDHWSRCYHTTELIRRRRR